MAHKGTHKSATAAKARAAPALIVDEELRIVELVGRTAPYVELAPGEGAPRLETVVHPALRAAVAEAVKAAFDARRPVRQAGVRYYQGDELRTVDITVTPTSHPLAGDCCAEIRFEEAGGAMLRPDVTPASASAPPFDADDRAVQEIQQAIAGLRTELETTTDALEQGLRWFATRLQLVEQEKERAVAELERAYKELEANHKDLQSAVNERERAELQAREERDFLDAVLDAAEALVVVMDPRGRILKLNHACERAVGRSLGKADNVLIWSLIPADQRRDVKKVFRDLVSTGSPSRFENDWLRDDGTRVRITWSNTVLENASKTVTHIIGVGVDVTEQRKAEAGLRDSEARSRALVEAAPSGVVAIDRSTRIHAVNVALERMFGYERAELLGQPLEMLLPKRFRRAHHNHLKRFFQHRVNRPMGASMELLGRAKDGREFPIEVGLGHFEAMDGSYAVAFVTDVTEKVSSQRLLEQNRDEIRDLAARLMTAQEDEQSRIARELHDGLVQELAALKLDLAVLARRPATAEAGLLEDIRRAEARIQQAAEGARVIAHELHPAALERLGLIPALRANADGVRRSTGVDILVEQEGAIPPLPRDLGLGLYRIAQEALWNAARHSGSRSVTIAVRTVAEKLVLEVIDQGKGFDFADVRSRRSLGLVSMEERARLIHADLGIESCPGAGTIVRVAVKLGQPA